jgi:hypothetical protein
MCLKCIQEYFRLLFFFVSDLTTVRFHCRQTSGEGKRAWSWQGTWTWTINLYFIDLCGVSGVVLGASSARRELLNVCFFHFVVDHSTLSQF